MIKQKNEDKVLSRLTAGRTIDEQIEHIRTYGNHGLPSMLKDRVLRGLGIPKPKESGEHLIYFGCYLPFGIPAQLRNYIRILDLLGISYTYLDKEFCCGLPIIRTAVKTEKGKYINQSKELMLLNFNAAEKKGTKTISYFCVGCTYMAKSLFPDEIGQHLYYPDLIIESMKKMNLRVADGIVGYYEGCHVESCDFAPGISLNWGVYRDFLNRIQGLKVIDLSNRICCRHKAQEILNTAEKKGLNTIVCSCNGCYVNLNTVTNKDIKVKYLLEILLEALYNAVSVDQEVW